MFKSLQVCGTSGSGKTTLLKQLLLESTPKVIASNSRGKPLVYEGEWRGGTIFVFGSYESVCGGCDTIPKVGIVADLLTNLHLQQRDGIAVFEGLMISHMIGTVGLCQQELGVERHWRAYLDTELRQCLDNVLARRKERGQTEPFNPTNTQKDWPRVRQSRDNWIKQGGVARGGR